MAEFFEVISQDMTEIMKIGSEEWEKEQGISGVPVKWVSYSNGQITSQGEMKEIIKQSIKPSMFDLPAGFDKEDNPWERQGSGMSPF